MMAAPRILIMAGGTGGHVFPALAVAQVLEARGWLVDWVGTCTRIGESGCPSSRIYAAYPACAGPAGKRLVV
jgi:UDP-N-acetylglucosamine--N-acetylmuramyl-(pentapeptide) pyrophosphoryl-undecaprenol N-acetylglucosamine transferase